MLGKTHLLAGLFIGLLFSFYFSSSLLFTVLLICIALFASLLPDIDEKSSYLGRHVPIVGEMFTHRGFFHSPLFLACVVVILYALTTPLIVGIFSASFISHLLLDGLTKQGVHIVPFGRIRGPFISGSVTEYFFRIVFLLGSILLLIQFM